MDQITAANIMARSEATLSPDLDIYRAIRQLLKSKLTGAPVVDDNGVLLGMLGASAINCWRPVANPPTC